MTGVRDILSMLSALCVHVLVLVAADVAVAVAVVAAVVARGVYGGLRVQFLAASQYKHI